MDVTIALLDKALLFLKSQDCFIPEIDKTQEFSEVEKKFLDRVFYKLYADGYAHLSEHKVTDKQSIASYSISFDGLLALENSPFMWKNQPYRWNANKIKLNVSWMVAKIIVVAANALIILMLSYLTYCRL